MNWFTCQWCIRVGFVSGVYVKLDYMEYIGLHVKLGYMEYIGLHVKLDNIGLHWFTGNLHKILACYISLHGFCKSILQVLLHYCKHGLRQIRTLHAGLHAGLHTLH